MATVLRVRTRQKVRNFEFETAFVGEMFYTSISGGRSIAAPKLHFTVFASFPAGLDESCQSSSRRKFTHNVFSLVCFFILAPLLFVSRVCAKLTTVLLSAD